jgi:hypothetical protein
MIAAATTNFKRRAAEASESRKYCMNGPSMVFFVKPQNGFGSRMVVPLPSIYSERLEDLELQEASDLSVKFAHVALPVFIVDHAG